LTNGIGQEERMDSIIVIISIIVSIISIVVFIKDQVSSFNLRMEYYQEQLKTLTMKGPINDKNQTGTHTKRQTNHKRSNKNIK